ncbi:MAG: (Fe-S)-binding protein, partial [SAR324 cluster bacterium]|nr:(Fe-S)-binding protein [SAR324 cluster bacterium]
GDRKTAREFALKNITTFNHLHLDAIITNAAGCGAQLQEYHHLFIESDEQTQKEISSAVGWKNFEIKVTDILEFLSAYTDLLANLPWSKDEDTVLYDAPCHLMHAQKVDENPRRVLNSLPGVKLVVLKESNWCCGSAGIYNLVQPELSAAVLNRKTESIRQTLAENPKASTIVTANPGCLYQIRAGLRSNNLDLRILHPVVYLAERLMLNRR